MPIPDDTLDRLRAARTGLVLSQPFFGTLALALEIVVSDQVPTAATDGQSVLMNPVFARALSQDEIRGVVAHEVLHCANAHMWRRGTRDPVRWNVACDLAVNHILAEAGFVLPSGALSAGQWRLADGQSAEWYYERLPPDVRRIGSPGGGGCDVLDGVPGEGQSAEGEAAEWHHRAILAASAARLYGTLPQTCERWLGARAKPRVDWRSVLRRFVQQAAMADYTWTRPNRRMLASGRYLPSLRSEQMPPIAVAIDTSGSIDAVTLAAFATEVSAIRDEAHPASMVLIYADCAVQRVEVVREEDPITLTPRGGGGTAFGPAITAAEHHDEAPCALVYLTDLCGAHRPQPPEIPLLWVAPSSSPTPPYGEHVEMT